MPWLFPVCRPVIVMWYHLFILYATIVNLCATQQDQPRSKSPPCEGGEGDYYAQLLAKSFTFQGKLNAITEILLSEGSIFNKRREGSGFTFAGQSIHQPLYKVFHRRHHFDQTASQEPPPLISYLNYTDISGGRWHQFRPSPHPSKGCNSPVRRICNKKLAQIKPEKWEEDPYLVYVLLCLAQLQERDFKPSSLTGHLSRLLVVRPSDQESIHIFEASITSDLLAMRDNPMTATTPTRFPTINHRKIPFRPYETFQRRLLSQGIGSGMMGQRFKRKHESDEDDEMCKQNQTS
ncbi:hypothetical protein ARAM_006128 [Aspergillus rambellii]|uniref:Uncharacterized protein n=1 Tax=Aspergillus rambellii TaxID=308745 RepID=A0A0F8V422_9EURO|nr:hypothetical protein ARAM_006128 [Aspergillus rambellii]